MRYRCLVFDHDDTTVNSTATIHHPCFERFLEEYYPGRHCSLEEYFIKNFAPGFLPMCREEYGMDDRMLELETRYWQEYVRSRIPDAYPGSDPAFPTLTRGSGRSWNGRRPGEGIRQ